MQAGDKVICVDDDFSKSWADPRDYFNHIPVKGRVYVIKEWGVAKNGEPGVRLLGVVSRNGDAVFYPWRFRLLTELQEESRLVDAIGFTIER